MNESRWALEVGSGESACPLLCSIPVVIFNGGDNVAWALYSEPIYRGHPRIPLLRHDCEEVANRK